MVRQNHHIPSDTLDAATACVFAFYLYMFLFLAEYSTLNIFHMSADGKRYFMSTASENLPAPIFGITEFYPTVRTSKIYDIEICAHEFVYHDIAQIRRNDEAPTTIYICKKCKFQRAQ